MSKSGGKSGGKSSKSGNTSAARRPQRGGAKGSAHRDLAHMQRRQRERLRRMTIIVGGFIGALVLIAALAQSLSPVQATTPTGGTPTVASTSTPIVRQVNITLTNFAIASSETSFKTGVQYHFVIHNTSSTAHEFMIAPPAQGDMSMEQLDKAALVHLTSQQLAPGALQTFDFVFDSPASAGQLEFACHLDNHYSLGMHLAITVAKG